MKATPLMKLLVLAALMLLGSGCASDMQTIKINSLPSGANVTFDGKSYSDTPSVVTVKKDGMDHWLFVGKSGCEEVRRVFRNNEYPQQVNLTLVCEDGTVVTISSDTGISTSAGETDMAEEGLLAQLKGYSSPRDRFLNEDVHFDYNSAYLSPEAQETLAFKAAWLLQNLATAITLQGHTDDRGTVEYNLALGDRRAQAVKMFLVNQGVDRSRLTAVSYGEEFPLDSSQNETAWSKNRRVHAAIY